MSDSSSPEAAQNLQVDGVQTEIRSSGQRVATTFELLEDILLYLSFHEIVRCKKVSRVFNATIANSPELQRHIFPSPELPKGYEGSRRANPLLDTSLLKQALAQGLLGMRNIVSIRCDIYNTRQLLLIRVEVDPLTVTRHGPLEVVWLYLKHLIPLARSRQKQECKAVTWRKMVAMQGTGQVDIRISTPGDGPIETFTLRGPQTLGDVLIAVVETAYRGRRRSVRVFISDCVNFVMLLFLGSLTWKYGLDGK
ncbi:hypothetical protein LTR86_006082 [Recurvomyces mirabilis]|nr:hypothetical protein LTR86_006082 [Recurvomyces mirabilis]